MKSTAERERCQHCDDKVVTRPGRLCWRCWHRPGIKELYSQGRRSASVADMSAVRLTRQSLGLGNGEMKGPAALPSRTIAANADVKDLADYLLEIVRQVRISGGDVLRLCEIVGEGLVKVHDGVLRVAESKER